jgi:DNA (cytosine-5)-methyltransferase 1
MPKEEMPNLDMLDSARYHACGNAVSVPVAEWIGYRIVENLGEWLVKEQAPKKKKSHKTSSKSS